MPLFIWVVRPLRGALTNLENALIDEDLARSAFYEQQLSDPDLTARGPSHGPVGQGHMAGAENRAASGLYGQPLVANWMADLPAIRQETHDAFEDLTAALLDLIETLPPRGTRSRPAGALSPASHLGSSWHLSRRRPDIPRQRPQRRRLTVE